MKRPETSEYAEFYAGYVSLVEETDIVSALQTQLTEIEILFAEMQLEKADYRYTPDKWSVKQLLGHMIDGERVFAYRALRFARNDQTPLPGFDQDTFMENSNFDERTIADLLEEFLYLRQANVSFFKTLDEKAWSNTGTASGAQVSVRAIAYVMVGHVRHHVNILRERYLN